LRLQRRGLNLALFVGQLISAWLVNSILIFVVGEGVRRWLGQGFSLGSKLDDGTEKSVINDVAVAFAISAPFCGSRDLPLRLLRM
jgi:hypothetical protein